MALLKQTTAFRRFFFINGYVSTSVVSIGSGLSLQSDGVTGLTINCKICKAGGSSFADPAAGSLTLTEITSPSAQGWYYGDFGTADADTLGALAYQLTWGGSNSYGEQDQVGAPVDLVTWLGVEPAALTGGISNNWVPANVVGWAGNNALADGSNYPIVGTVQTAILCAVTGDLNGKVLGNGGAAIVAVGVKADGSVVDVGSIAGSAPAATLLAAIYANFESGTAQAGGASSITLRAGASAVGGTFNKQAVYIFAGTGTGQTNKGVVYNGTTKVLTVEDAWVTQPDNTSQYVILGRIE